MNAKLSRLFKAAAAVCCAGAVMLGACGCTADLTEDAAPVAKEDFRVTSYLVGDTFVDSAAVDYSHFEQITDFIFIGMANFDTSGKITLAQDFETAYDNIKSHLPQGASFYVNIMGPDFTTDSQDWNEQMADKGALHNQAFESGNLEGEIKALLDDYGFDGVFFDYEYPIDQNSWDGYNAFIVKLDEYLGDGYKIGMALSDWNLQQTPEAMAATDLVELMSYDNWDKDGNHAPYENAANSLQEAVEAGYDRSKVDLGLPFYARPTTEDAYWYDYKTYGSKIDENGLYADPETSLTFSFNTYDVIKQKTVLAAQAGFGGVMVWHYAYDSPASDPKSLFNAVTDGINTAYSAA